MLLQLEHIRVSYDKINALKDISLSVEEGEIVSIIGANGAGKTTLINSISGVVKKHGGKISFHDKDITNMAGWKIARLGLVQIPEGRKVFPKLTVTENMELGAFPEKNRRTVKELLARMYELFSVLQERKDQSAGTLSGGEQQMLAVARGLMAQPKLLMFDEPSMGLAPIMVEKVFHIIKEINNQGTTILLVEQNARKSLQISKRAYVLETGRIVLTGTGQELLNNQQIKKAYLGA